MTPYGNWVGGTASASGGDSSSFQYTQYYSLQNGQWSAVAGSGSASSAGGATGSGWTSASFSLSGSYSNCPNQTTLFSTAAGDWSGSVSASGSDSTSYSYNTSAAYTSASGWTQTGTASAAHSGAESFLVQRQHALRGDGLRQLGQRYRRRQRRRQQFLPVYAILLAAKRPVVRRRRLGFGQQRGRGHGQRLDLGQF